MCNTLPATYTGCSCPRPSASQLKRCDRSSVPCAANTRTAVEETLHERICPQHDAALVSAVVKLFHALRHSKPSR